MKSGLAARSVLCGAILLAGVIAVIPGCGKKKTVGPIKGDPAMVVAEVEDQKITLGEVDRAVEQVYRTGRRPGVNPNSPEDSLQMKAIDDLISQRILYLQARKAGMVPTAQEGADFLTQLQQSRFPNEESLLVALKRLGMTKDDFLSDWQMNTAINKFVQKTVQDTIKITPEQARTYYDTHPEEFQHGEMAHARHILLRVPDNASPEVSAQIKAKLESLAAQIKGGADFGRLAQANSEDPTTASRGGDLGLFRRGQMVAPFDSVAFAMAPGTLSDPVRTRFGWHLIKAEEKVAPGPYAFDDIKDRLMSVMAQKRVSDTIQTWIDGLKKSTKIKRKV